jgi:hypothetical protein
MLPAARTPAQALRSAGHPEGWVETQGAREDAAFGVLPVIPGEVPQDTVETGDRQRRGDLDEMRRRRRPPRARWSGS